MKEKGRTKVLFGSNHPMMEPKVCFRELEDLELDGEMLSLSSHENSERVFEVRP